MGTEAQGRGGERIVTHADGCTTRSPRTSIGAGESWSNIAQQSSEWRSQTKQHFGCGDVLWYATNTQNQQSYQSQFKQCEVGQSQQGNLEEALAQIVVSFLPTPTASDNPAKNTGKMNQTHYKKKSFSSHWETFQLNPRFVAEMMGFPADWTERPFYKEEKPENQHSITGEKNL
jgi:hypothetical protein